MPVDWDAETERYSGDVRLNDRRDTPIGLRGPEDVYVQADAVDGPLQIVDAEYVYTDVPEQGGDPVEDVSREVTGDLEDGYVEDVDGTTVVAEVEDVFVAYGAADELETRGIERVFHDDSAAPTMSPEDYEVSVAGWKQSREARDPRNGVSVAGARNEVTVTESKRDLTVYVMGWGNEVHVEGRNMNVTVYFVGRDNTVTVGPYVRATVGAESGSDNVLDSEPLPHDAVIETTRSEAYSDAFVGRHKVTYQEPAADKDWCPNCGESADAVIVRRQRDSLFLFGYPVRTYDSGGKSYECEHCTRNAVGGVDLDPDERTDALQ